MTYVPVQSEVKYEDIWSVSETFIGKQLDMYQDFEALQRGITRFAEEWKAWMASADLPNNPHEPSDG
jgi:hypothetical protein